MALKRSVQVILAHLAVFTLPTPVHALNLVDGVEFSSRSVEFERPARMCALAQIDPNLIKLVQSRAETELRSIAKTPSPLVISIEEAIKSEIRYGGDAALYDAQGNSIYQIFDTESLEFEECVKEKDAVVLRVQYTTDTMGKPYYINATIRQSNKQISEEFARNALEELDKYYGSIPPENPRAPYLRAGLGWSVDWDTRRLLTALFDRVSWANYGPYGNRQP